MIERFWLDHRDQGFGGVSISVDDPADRIAACMKNKGYGVTAAPTHASLAAAFGNVGTAPTSFMADRDGRIRHKIAGAVHYPRLEKRIVPLLQSRTAEEPR